ncbi:hypothetical protein [Sphaerochaeta sp. PS]|uniref:hypothetical protein n=1 Tax=Sphaerochaeta sp. PS TaxID=3076336 RepID=UPI0028A3DE61|nr:hypothetical protein [Sphaerochaeta sp. PS]MDT4763335.1 hypothetical protein [Sphaerochaeta sp. PS]
MNYEDLFIQYQNLEKSLKDKTKLLAKLEKAISKEMEGGDISRCITDTAVMKSVSAEVTSLLQEIESLVSSFDGKEYIESGDFVSQMLEQCAENGVDVTGSSPNFEMFPNKVRIDVENQDIYLDRKKVACLRPVVLVQAIKKGQEKLLKASFNANKFASELIVAYDLALADLGKNPGTDLYLQKLYNYMVPMSRFRKDYDLQSYAFDLARLYAVGSSVEIKDGRKIQWGTSRDGKKGIRILDGNGREEFLATIRLF